MKVRAGLVGLLATSALGLSVPVGFAGSTAQDDALQKRLFGHGQTKATAHACFRRAYDGRHLADHPRQNVRTMLLLVTAKPRDANSPFTYQLGLDVAFRKPGTHFTAAGDCGSDRSGSSDGKPTEALHCGLDCDGGSIEVSLKDDMAMQVVFPEPARAEGQVDGSPSSKDTGRFGADDTVFRLERAPLTDCLSLAGDSSDKRALRNGN